MVGRQHSFHQKKSCNKMTTLRYLFTGVIIFILSTGTAIAQSAENFPPPEIPAQLFATETTAAITVDGRLQEAAWQQAVAVNNFFRVEPRQGGAYRYQTFVKILYDKTNLYFGVFCKDSSGRKNIRVQDLRRDFSFGNNDIFFVQLDPQNLKRFCVSFQTTPYGNQRDLQVFDDSFLDNEWDALWRVRTQMTDSGYYAEFAIPFVSLRYQKPASPDSVSWGITFSRLARKDYEQTVFPAIPQSFSPYRMSYAAQLKGLRLPPPSINLRVQPYTLFQYEKSVNNAGVATNKTTVKPGGEIKWAINPHAVLDVTLNTDFAQADVDRAINNLTRFNVFFPERRQFFLENSGVYAGADIEGVKPFFSRSIGLANAQFNADPVAIDAGIRYTDRNQKRTVAGMYVHQRAGSNQPGANFGVLRYLKNYGKQNNIGVMLTHRGDEADTKLGIASRNNTTVTVDGLIRPNDSWTIQYLASAARDNTNDSIGFAGSFFASYTPNNFYAGWLTKYVDEKYVPGMGFVFANNTIHHNPGGYYIWRPANKLGKLIRRWDPGVFVNWYQNANDFTTQEFSLYIFPVYIITASNGQIEYAVLPTWQNFTFPFPILGKTIAAGKYQYARHLVRYETDASKKISLESKYEFGGYYNGRLSTLTLGSRIAPLPHIAITFNYEHNVFKDFGAASDDFETNLYTGGIRLAYNPRIQLSTFYQYNSFDERGRWNVRGSWEFAPLSFLYFVFNDNSFRNSPVGNQSLITKVTYLKQF
jgi:Domain of unknown function (DUF5916)/Carbohydrate family 9 binding domain-like